MGTTYGFHHNTEEIIARLIITACICGVLAVFVCLMWRCPSYDKEREEKVKRVKGYQKISAPIEEEPSLEEVDLVNIHQVEEEEDEEDQETVLE